MKNIWIVKLRLLNLEKGNILLYVCKISRDVPSVKIIWGNATINETTLQNERMTTEVNRVQSANLRWRLDYLQLKYVFAFCDPVTLTFDPMLNG